LLDRQSDEGTSISTGNLTNTLLNSLSIKDSIKDFTKKILNDTVNDTVNFNDPVKILEKLNIDPLNKIFNEHPIRILENNQSLVSIKKNSKAETLTKSDSPNQAEIQIIKSDALSVNEIPNETLNDENIVNNSEIVDLLKDDINVGLLKDYVNVNLLKDDTKVNLTKDDTKVNLSKDDTKVNLLKDDTKVNLIKDDVKVNLIKDDVKVDLLKDDTKVNLSKEDVIDVNIDTNIDLLKEDTNSLKDSNVVDKIMENVETTVENIKESNEFIQKEEEVRFSDDISINFRDDKKYESSILDETQSIVESISSTKTKKNPFSKVLKKFKKKVTDEDQIIY
jgi:hypothetical protein